jgi:ubiquitin conjugation factor E4 B
VPETERASRVEDHRNEEGRAGHLMKLTNSSVHGLLYMTKVIVDPFLLPDFVNRMADLLCYMLVKLVGPDVSSIKVQNADKYHFKPRDLLGDIIGIFVNLSTRPAFIEAVAADERSYSEAIFAKALRTVRKKAIISEMQCRKFDEALQKVVRSQTCNITSLTPF